MNAPGREVIYKNEFLDDLHRIELYLAQTNPRRGRQFVSDVYDFTVNVIEINPFAFPEHPTRLTPAREFRRAVFHKDYIVVYRVTDEFLKFLSIYPARLNPGSIRLEE